MKDAEVQANFSSLESSSDDDSDSDNKEDEGWMNLWKLEQMEILELEMRARAIRMLLKQEEGESSGDTKPVELSDETNYTLDPKSSDPNDRERESESSKKDVIEPYSPPEEGKTHSGHQVEDRQNNQVKQLSEESNFDYENDCQENDETLDIETHEDINNELVLRAENDSLDDEFADANDAIDEEGTNHWLNDGIDRNNDINYDRTEGQIREDCDENASQENDLKRKEKNHE